MEYYRQTQTVSHSGQAPQSYMYQQPTSAQSNSGMYYQAMNNYPQQPSPYGMQDSVSQGSSMVQQQGVAGATGNGRRARGTDTNAPIHPNMSRGQDDTPLRMVVDAKYVGAIIGQQGNKIREITKESKARCIVDAHKGMRDAQGTAEKVIMIYGTPENTSKAVVKILEVIETEKEKERDREVAAGDSGLGDLEKSCSNEVELKLRAHNQLVGRLIGKQGSTIKKIMTDTDTVIYVSNLAESGPTAVLMPAYAEMLMSTDRTITVKASTVAAVSAAEQRISAKLRQSYEYDVANRVAFGGAASAALPMMPMTYDASAMAGGIRPQLTSSFKCAKMFVPNNMVGAIIGSKGSHIRNIMRTTGAVMRIEGNDKIREEKEKKEKEDGDETTESPVEDSTPKETNTNDKEDDTEGEDKKKKENVDNEEVSERLVTITGNDQQIYRAQYSIFAKIAEQQGQYVEEVKLRSEVNVPSRLVGRIIGKGGQNVRELQRLTGAHVKIAEENNPENKEKEDDKESDGANEVGETTVRVIGNMTATLGVEARVATLISEFARNSVNERSDRPNGASSAGPTNE